MGQDVKTHTDPPLTATRVAASVRTIRYKQGRRGFDELIGEEFLEDFYDQLNDLKKVLPHLGFYCFGVVSWEADDIAGCLSWKFSENHKVFQ